MMYATSINTSKIKTKSNIVRLKIESIGSGTAGFSISGVISGNVSTDFPPQILVPVMLSLSNWWSSGTGR
ncbi:hypothetical protein [Nitrosopumilus sp.]|uniref:hypothetical protein n=1 Tax=Nitrosopumilus sp. TaxID=2024843 RepID=UPI00292FB550|nr:hypothetical protein [Nitrosopumilus sp.]